MDAAASRASAQALIFAATVRGKVVFVAGAPVAVAGIAWSNAALAAATVVAAAAGFVVTAARAAAAAVWNRPRRAITGGRVRGFGVRKAAVQAQQQSRAILLRHASILAKRLADPERRYVMDDSLHRTCYEGPGDQHCSKTDLLCENLVGHN